MTQHIHVIARTQHITVNAASATVSIVQAGPQGPAGVGGGGAAVGDADAISIEDVAGNYTGTEVEAALAEAASRLVVLEAQPLVTVDAVAPTSPNITDVWVDIS